MQRGCMQRNNRKEGPDVWQFRWSEIRLDGKRFYHKKIVGTVEQYPDEDAARRSVVGLVSELNADGRPTNSGVLTVAQLCDHFEQRELSKDNSWRSHSPCGFRNDRTDSGRLVGNRRIYDRPRGSSATESPTDPKTDPKRASHRRSCTLSSRVSKAGGHPTTLRILPVILT
jgi:hypothetical protein